MKVAKTFLALMALSLTSTLAHAAAKSPKLQLASLPAILNATLSPDGRWLAGVEQGNSGREKIVIYDFQTGRYWKRALGRFSAPRDEGHSISWRPDSRACVFGGQTGWLEINPSTRRVRRITAHPFNGEVIAWSPRTSRMAMFSNQDHYPYCVWNGHHLSHGIDWTKAVHFPVDAEPQAWDAAWSADEKHISLRFYGHSARGSDTAGHVVILNPRTGKASWGYESGPATWLDNRRFMALDYDGGLDLADLSVHQIATKTSNCWLKGALVCTLSRDRHTIWAITSHGDLWRTPASKPVWRCIRRKAVPPALLEGNTALDMSPRGDMLALHDNLPGEQITLFSTSPTHFWTLPWHPARGEVEFVGWSAGKAAPLVAWREKSAGAVLIGWIRSR